MRPRKSESYNLSHSKTWHVESLQHCNRREKQRSVSGRNEEILESIEEILESICVLSNEASVHDKLCDTIHKCDSRYEVSLPWK